MKSWQARNACFGEAAGWERPNWFAPEGVTPEYQYSFGKQNWFDYNAAEHKAAREGVVLFDQSSFLQVPGAGARCDSSVAAGLECRCRC